MLEPLGNYVDELRRYLKIERRCFLVVQLVFCIGLVLVLRAAVSGSLIELKIATLVMVCYRLPMFGCEWAHRRFNVIYKALMEEINEKIEPETEDLGAVNFIERNPQ